MVFFFQGDIASCAGTYLYVWSVNGQLIVKENTSLQNNNHIQCCAMSEVNPKYLDQCPVSPFNIFILSTIKVVRIKGMLSENKGPH